MPLQPVSYVLQTRTQMLLILYNTSLQNQNFNVFFII